MKEFSGKFAKMFCIAIFVSFNSNGSPNTAFNINGNVTTTVSTGHDYDHAIQSDDKIVETGIVWDGPFALAGYIGTDSTTVDRYVATTGNDTSNDCTSSGSPCATIIHAVDESISGDTIHIAAGTYTEIGEIDISKDINLVGAGMSDTIIDGDNDHRIFWIHNLATVSISDLTTQNGNYSVGSGGGIYTDGNLSLVRVKVTNNTSSGSGAGMFISNSSGTTTITNSVISNNTCTVNGYGGGIFIYGGSTIDLNRVEISGNTAINNSGGLHIQGGGTINLTNSTVSGNTANVAGAITNTSSSTLNILNSTIANNKLTGTSPYTGGINNYATVNIQNSIIADNDLSQCIAEGGSTGVWNSNGYNISSDDTCDLDGTNDQASTDPLLETMKDNGGYSQTHALRPNSPAVDEGDDTICSAAPVNSSDQRGITRPQGDHCDIGAFEIEQTNDEFYFATDISALSYTDSISTANATSAPDDPILPGSCGIPGNGQATVWYTYAPSSISAIAVNTEGADYDTFIAIWVWEGPSLEDLEFIACNDDAGGTQQSAVAIRVTGGKTYYIEIGQP